MAQPRPIDQAYVSDRRLADGTHVRLRLLTAADREALADGFRRMSAESRYRRFFSAMPRLPDSLLTALTTTDNRDHLAVVAHRIDAQGRPREGLGVARFVRLKDAPDAAEAAVAVVDDVQGRGLGSMLLSVLARAARERGITKFTGLVQADNEKTKSLVRKLARDPEIRFDGGALAYEVDLPPVPLEEHRDSALYRLLRLAADELAVVFRAFTADRHGADAADGHRSAADSSDAERDTDAARANAAERKEDA
jgi:GNAT superfamily N-acetyltransferase